jgi:hypothetical protein
MIVPTIKTLNRPIASLQLEIVAECLVLATGVATGTEAGFMWIDLCNWEP